MEQCYVVNKDFENQNLHTKHFITTTSGGISKGNYAHFNLGSYCGEESKITKSNKEILCNKLGIKISDLFIPREVHKNNIVYISQNLLQLPKELEEQMSQADAVVTSEKGIAVAITTADCVPIICTDNKKFVAAIHAGWRGITVQIIDNTINHLIKLGCHREDLTFLIGPCISGNNYEVDDTVWNEFCKIFNRNEQERILIKKTDSKYFPDLRTAASIQIEKYVSLDNIFHYKADTYTDDRFYSARKSGIKTGRFLTGIMLI